MSTAEPTHRAAGDVALTEQFDNHDGGRPEAIGELAGIELHLVGPVGATAVVFETDRRLRFEEQESGLWGIRAGRAAYEALALRDGWTAVVVRLDDRHSTFLVIDRDRRRGLAVVSALHGDGPGGAREATEYVQVGIGGPAADPIRRTSALVGRRIEWRYSDTHAFEHIYLNPTAYCWHGLAGPEQWIGDVDPYVAYELDTDLFLFSWSETVVPFNGVAILDLCEWRSIGRFFGWDTKRRRADQIIVGANGRLLNTTDHHFGS